MPIAAAGLSRVLPAAVPSGGPGGAGLVPLALHVSTVEDTWQAVAADEGGPYYGDPGMCWR